MKWNSYLRALSKDIFVNNALVNNAIQLYTKRGTLRVIDLVQGLRNPICLHFIFFARRYRILVSG